MIALYLDYYMTYQVRYFSHSPVWGGGKSLLFKLDFFLSNGRRPVFFRRVVIRSLSFPNPAAQFALQVSFKKWATSFQ